MPRRAVSVTAFPEVIVAGAASSVGAGVAVSAAAGSATAAAASADSTATAAAAVAPDATVVASKTVTTSIRVLSMVHPRSRLTALSHSRPEPRKDRPGRRLARQRTRSMARAGGPR